MENNRIKANSTSFNPNAIVENLPDSNVFPDDCHKIYKNIGQFPPLDGSSGLAPWGFCWVGGSECLTDYNDFKAFSVYGSIISLDPTSTNSVELSFNNNASAQMFVNNGYGGTQTIIDGLGVMQTEGNRWLLLDTGSVQYYFVPAGTTVSYIGTEPEIQQQGTYVYVSNPDDNAPSYIDGKSNMIMPYDGSHFYGRFVPGIYDESKFFASVTFDFFLVNPDNTAILIKRYVNGNNYPDADFLYSTVVAHKYNQFEGVDNMYNAVGNLGVQFFGKRFFSPNVSSGIQSDAVTFIVL